MKKLFLIILFTLVLSGGAYADYYVTGRIKGGETKLLGFGLSIVNVDAVKVDGELYSIQKVYKKVSEYDPKKGRCWINTKLGQIGKVLNFFRDQAFYEKMSDGTYRKLKLEYITFPCVKR